MGFLDELKRLTHPYEDEMEDDYDEDEDVYEDEEEPEDVEPTPPPREEPSRRREREYQEPPRRNSGGKVVNIHATTQLQVVLVKPERYENASEIADHLRDKRHGRGLAHMATALRTLGNHAVNVITRQAAGQNGGRHHGEHLDSSGFPLVHILAGITCSGGKNAHMLFDNDLRQLVDMRVHEHEIHAKRLVRQSACRANLLA